MTTIKNPALYRRMSEPHASQQDAAKAVSAFFDELQTLRERHRIRDLLCVAQVAFVDGETEMVRAGVISIGSSMEALHLAAHAYGTLRSDTEAKLDAAVALTPRKRGKS